MFKIMPNQLPAHRTAAEAWQYSLKLIESFGDMIRTEDGKLTKEIQNLHLCILEPLEGWPIAGSGYDMPYLNAYAEQLMDPDAKGFDYDYGNRLRQYPQGVDESYCDGCHDSEGFEPCYVDQIECIIDNLKASQTTRRAVAITWQPDIDTWHDHVPCLQLLDFLIRGGKLHCTAFFRSWDCGRAAPANMYGLAKLMQHIADAVGVPVGSLTVVAASAHIYQE